MLRHWLDQMVIEGAPLETRHGKDGRGVPVVLTCIPLGQRHRTQPGIAVQVALGLGAGLGVGQTAKLCGISAQNLDVAARLVITVDRQRFQGDSWDQAHGSPMVGGVDPAHQAEVPRLLHVLEDLMREPDLVIGRLNV
jgi:hypothetical protein